jgi:AcrR family transcriptional regulator
MASRARTARAGIAPSPAGILSSERSRPPLVEIQRARIVAGATEVVAELGYGGLTVAEVIVRAKISRRTFYEIFEDREECFLAAFDAALACVAEPVVTAYRGEGVWRERIAAALGALLALFDAQPALARLLVVDALAAGPVALERRAAVLDALVRAVGEGRRATGRGRDPGPLAAEGVVGAVLGVLHARLLDEGRRKPLRTLAAPLMSTIVLPFLGAAAAARELERPAPRATANGAASKGRSPRANPLHGLDMRLTYRTLCVLCAVREQPGASNREVAEGAGIADQGQMSKLLARLLSLGLIENGQPARADGGRFKGEPNAWMLTARGAEVVEAIRDRPAVVR